eukprot:817137_1
MLLSAMMSIFLMWFIGFSFSDMFKTNPFPYILLFKLIQMLLDILLAANIHDVLLISPLMIGVAIAEFLVTMGAATFMDFLTAYVIELVIIVAERVYMDPQLKHAAMMWPVYKAKIKARLLYAGGKTDESAQYYQYALDLQDEVESQTVEPMLEAFAVYANET